MAKAMIIFEDKGKDVVIGIKNATSDKPTPAQRFVLKLFRQIKESTYLLSLDEKAVTIE